MEDSEYSQYRAKLNASDRWDGTTINMKGPRAMDSNVQMPDSKCKNCQTLFAKIYAKEVFCKSKCSDEFKAKNKKVKIKA